MTIIHPEQKMSNLIAENPYLLLLLEHFEIRLPLQDKSIETICKEAGINDGLFCAFAGLYICNEIDDNLKLDENDAVDMVTFLKTSHRYYSEQIYPEIMKLINEMSELNKHKEMKLVTVFFTEYFKEVTAHLDYENDVFHPYVLWLTGQLTGKITDPYPSEYSVEQYKAHHDDIEEKLNDLKRLLIKYLPMGEDRFIRRKLLFLLSELELDLRVHSEIEELILMPLTVKLEKKQIEKNA
ncbi:MAG: hypothetical protein ACK5KP_11640 [Paludibacteraceae bacterium]